MQPHTLCPLKDWAAVQRRRSRLNGYRRRHKRMYRAMIGEAGEAARGSKSIDKRGPIAFDARVPQTSVTGRGMPSGADPGPSHLIVHVDRDRRRAEEKVANAYVGDVGCWDVRREAKSASGDADQDRSGQAGAGGR